MPTIAEIRSKFPMYKDVPDGELVRGLHSKFYSDMPYQEFLKNIDFKQSVNPTEGMSGMEKFNAGMGKAFTDIGHGAQQMVGMGPNAQEVRDSRELDRPLMKTGAGVLGNVAGNVSMLAPLAVAPGGATVAGAGVLGALTGALQPTEGATERLKNMGIGGALGAGTQFLGTTGANMVGEAAGKRQAAAEALRSRNAVRDETLNAGREAGYVTPPSAVNPSWLNKRLESIAGKAAVGQEASMRNQGTTDALARRASGLPEDAALSETALSGARSTAAEPYRQIAGINQQAAKDLEAWKASNLESKLQWTHYGRSGDPAAYKAAVASETESKGLLDSIETAAQQTGKPELVKALREARVQIAKIHNVENEANVGTGSVDASVLGRALDRGAPLSGELKTIAQFQQAFPQYMREGSRIPTPGVSKSEALSSALLGAAGHAAAGPAGLLAGGLPLLSGPTRSLVLSKPYQSLMANAPGEVGALTNSAAALKDPETQRRLAMALRTLALPSIPEMVNQ